MTLIFGATTVSTVCLLKLLACSNVKASGMRVAVHVIFSVVVLDLKQNWNDKRNFNKE
jgi:hypothetical protein